MEKGFTFIELMICGAIIGIVTVVGAPNITSWNIKKQFRNGYRELIDNLAEARIQALTRNTTARVVFAGTPGNYTMTAFYSDTPTSTCTIAGSWTQFYARTLPLDATFDVTGTGVGNVCFYRDQTSSGGSYNIEQVDGGTEYGSADISVTIATGYVDASFDQ